MGLVSFDPIKVKNKIEELALETVQLKEGNMVDRRSMK